MPLRNVLRTDFEDPYCSHSNAGYENARWICDTIRERNLVLKSHILFVQAVYLRGARWPDRGRSPHCFQFALPEDTPDFGQLPIPPGLHPPPGIVSFLCICPSITASASLSAPGSPLQEPP